MEDKPGDVVVVCLVLFAVALAGLSLFFSQHPLPAPNFMGETSTNSEQNQYDLLMIKGIYQTWKNVSACERLNTENKFDNFRCHYNDSGKDVLILLQCTSENQKVFCATMQFYEKGFEMKP